MKYDGNFIKQFAATYEKVKTRKQNQYEHYL